MEVANGIPAQYGRNVNSADRTALPLYALRNGIKFSRTSSGTQYPRFINGCAVHEARILSFERWCALRFSCPVMLAIKQRLSLRHDGTQINSKKTENEIISRRR